MADSAALDAVLREIVSLSEVCGTPGGVSLATIEDLERRSASLPDREEHMRALCNLSILEACMGREEHDKLEGAAQKIAESILKECKVARSTPEWIPRYERLFGFVTHCGSIQPWGQNHRGLALRSLLSLYAMHNPLMTGRLVLERLELLGSSGEMNLSGSLVPEAYVIFKPRSWEGDVDIYGQNYVFGQVGGRFHWMQFGSGCFTDLLATYTVTGTARVVGVFRSEDGASKARSTTFRVIGLLHGALAVLLEGPRTGWTGETKIEMLGDPPVEVVVSDVELRPGSRTTWRIIHRWDGRSMQDVTLQYPEDARKQYLRLKEADDSLLKHVDEFFRRRSPEYRKFWETQLRPLKTPAAASSG